MKLNENQLRRLIGDVITEAKATDEDALNQFQAAVKTLLKLGPKVSASLSRLADQLRVVANDEANVDITMAFDLSDELDEASYTIENLFGAGGAAEIDLLTTIAKASAMAQKIVKKGPAKKSTKRQPAPRPFPSSDWNKDDERGHRGAQLQRGMNRAAGKPNNARQKIRRSK